MLKYWLFLSLAIFCFNASAKVSITDAKYVEPSAHSILQANQRIADWYASNYGKPFIVQRLSERAYFVQSHFYASTFYVGNTGVLLIDPSAGRAQAILEAIAQVTTLPVTSILYSQSHYDHLSGSLEIVKRMAERGQTVEIVTLESVADRLQHFEGDRYYDTRGQYAPITRKLTGSDTSYKFEELDIAFHGFKYAFNAEDYTAILLTQEKILHAPHLMNPDSLPHTRFGVSDTFLNYERVMRTLEKLDWVFLNTGHGNIGTKADLNFHYGLMDDMHAAILRASQNYELEPFADHPSYAIVLAKRRAHIVQTVTEQLRDKYQKYDDGFEHTFSENVGMMLDALRY